MTHRKVVVFGDTLFSKSGIMALHSLGFQLYFIVSKEDHSKFEKLNCLDKGQSLFLFHSITDLELETHIKKIAPDYIFLFGLKHKMPDRIISIPKIAAINSHPSLLPELKGPNPWYWAIYQGLETSAVTLHQLSSEFDGGDIIAQFSFSIHPKDTRGILSQKVNYCLSQLIIGLKDSLLKGTLDFSPQQEKGSYFSFPGNQELYLNFNRMAFEVDANIRANNPNLPSILNLNSTIMNVREAEVTSIPATAPYTVLVEDKRLFVSAKDVFLELKILELSEEGIFTAARFLELCPIQSGVPCTPLL